MPRTIILGIESSCDETAAALVADGRQVLSSVIASQIDLHQKYGGVVPEIAARAHIENILPVLRECFEQAHLTKDDLAAVAVAACPGLTPALLIGVTAASGSHIGRAEKMLPLAVTGRIASGVGEEFQAKRCIRLAI